jgi:hypothetical protein
MHTANIDVRLLPSGGAENALLAIFAPFRETPGVFFTTWLRISMDRISDSDSEDAGSIPAGATT